MRASTIQTLVVAVVEALVPSVQANKGDRFRHDPDETPGEQRVERTFILIQDTIRPAEGVFSGRVFVSSLGLDFTYSDAPGIGARIADDGEQILAALEDLHTQHAEIFAVENISPWTPRPGGPGQLVCTVDIEVRYQLTGV